MKYKTLLVTNVDGAYVETLRNNTALEEELRYIIGGMWEQDKEEEIIEELLKSGQVDVNDGSCTSYELG